MEYDKILEIALESQWKPICDEIKREIGLKELEKSQLEYEKMKKELVENENNIKGVHDNIICNNCFKIILKEKDSYVPNVLIIIYAKIVKKFIIKKKSMIESIH